jgi:hypothetical protein
MSVPGGWLSGESVWMHGRMFGLLCLQRMNNYSFIEKIVRSIYAEGVNQYKYSFLHQIS